MAMSVIFIVIELRARFDKSFLIFGISNLLLSFFCAIDIWIQPGLITLQWTKIQHIIAAFFPALILWYLLILLGNNTLRFVRILFFIGICFAALFSTDTMFRPLGKEFASTMVYNCTFAPFMLASIIAIFIYLCRNVLKVPRKERKVLFFHLLGGATLACGGILDMVNVFFGYRIFPQISTFTTPGLLLFGLIVTYVFIDRLTAIIRTREITFSKLQEAYKELEEVQTLKELGQSTAIINHEIKNYTFVISGNAQYLFDHAELSEKHKKIVASIVNTAIKMSEFSKEILNFSKARILSDKRKLAIFSLIGNCIQEHFPNKQESVIIENKSSDVYVHGDWQKLEHVFVNIIKNSFEAEATLISIKALRRDTVLLLIIEDNGIGCTEEQMGALFKSFYTTKKGKGGTGLGMCVIRSIIESHGGYINAYSKNILNDGSHGLVLNIAFPIYKEGQQEIEGKKDPVVLIKDGIENLSLIIRIFQNVMITPYIVHKAEEIDLKRMPLEKTAVYASANSLDQFKKKFGTTTGQTHALVHGSKNAVFVVNETKDKSLQEFSEKYILENLK
jgi:signal transduction histidine kinase